MERFRRHKTDAYATISTIFLRDTNLSLKAKGFMTVIMSLPDAWDFSIEGMSTILKEGKGAIYHAIDELLELRYCERTYLSDSKGRRTGVEYAFFEKPQDTTKSGSSLKRESSDMDTPEMDTPNMGNRTQYSIDSNIEKKEEKKESSSALESAGIKEDTSQSFELNQANTRQEAFQAQGSTNVVESDITTKPSKKSKREGKKGLLFRDSEEFDIEVFKQKMLSGGGKNKELYANVDLEIWHEYMLNYSDSKGERRECWTSATKMFIRNNNEKDSLKPKLYLKTYNLSDRSFKAKEFMRQIWYFDEKNIETENYVNEMLAYFDTKPKEEYDNFATQVSAYRINIFGNDIHKGCGVEYAIGIKRFFGTRAQDYKDGMLNVKNWEAYMEDVLRKKGGKNG